MRLIDYVRADLEKVKMLEYTTEYSDEAKAVQKNGDFLNSTDHSEMSKIDFMSHYSSRPELIEWYFGYLSNERKLDAVGKTAMLIKQKGYRKILSFGSGPGILELFLKQMFGNKVDIMATDYDLFYVEEGRKLLGEDILFEQFDFYNDDLNKLLESFFPDLVVFFGSSCSMDDNTYYNFLTTLKKLGVRAILSFEAGIISEKEMRMKKIRLCIDSVRRFYKRIPKNELHNVHAYVRTKKELEHILYRSNFLVTCFPCELYMYAYYLTD